MMRGTDASCGDDRRLAGRIAMLMRVGTVAAAVLLSAGAVFLFFHVGTEAEVFLSGGCAILVLLPMIRLVMMTVHFARTNKPFVPVSVLVILFVFAGTAAGLWL
jgi:uncharacterized membrane protein